MKQTFVPMMLMFGMVSSVLGVQGAEQNSENELLLPELLKNQTFVYDELEHGAGNILYTLTFTDNGYKLYNDHGAGIVAEGEVAAGADKSLLFENEQQDFTGSYTGSAFQKPSVSVVLNGKEMTFQLDSESGEYVYLSYLGVYEGEMQEKPALLILERWFEFYLHTDEQLIRGTYDIYEDGTIRFTTADEKVFEGVVKKEHTEEFSAKDIEICLEMTSENTSFTYGEKEVSYEAEHAMGAYTLSIYDTDVFTIHGVDGLLKAMGTLETTNEGGVAEYFPRMITNETDETEKLRVEFTNTEEGMIFPDSTYLLPRSGNIDEETGYGSYWTAGTQLEFRKQAGWEDTEYIVYEKQDTNGKTAPLAEVFADASTDLQQTMPSLGTAKPLVLLIEFPDQRRPRFITATDIENSLFDIENKDSLSAYYYRSSYGNLSIDGTVLDWYCMGKERGQYDSDKEIMREVLDYYIDKQGLDLSEYDANGDGVVDSLYVLWAGNMDSSSGMWSGAYRSTWKNSPEEWETKVTGYIFVPGTTVWSTVPPLVCNVNSLTHETGHLLGLNDYYSYDTTNQKDDEEAYTGGALEGGLGGMDMMDANIGEQNAFSKWLLGWLEPEIITFEEISLLSEEEKVYTLYPSNEQGDALFIKLKEEDSMFTELLVIEVISSTMNARELTRLEEPVVRILHVDASLDEENLQGNWRGFGFKNENSYTSTKFISILEADGKDEVLNYLPVSAGSKISYDVNDYFRAGDLVTPNTYPNTNGYDIYGNAAVYNGLTIKIESVSPEGETVIRLGYEAQKETLQIESVSPDPVIVPYEKENPTKISKDTEEICVVFQSLEGQEIELQETTEDALKKIKLISGNEEIHGYTAELEKNRLNIRLTEGLEENSAYTLVIPANILSSKNPAVTNNYNSIFGFITE